MSGLQQIIAPTNEPVSLVELKAAIKMDDDLVDDDAVLQANIIAARRLLEQHTGRAFVSQTWLLALDAMPYAEEPLWEGVRQGADLPSLRREIVLPRPPLLSVTQIETFDDSDNATVYAASNYYVDTVSDPGRVVLRTGGSWPTIDRVANGLQITFVAGYGTNWNDVPMEIRAAMIELVRVMYDECGGDGSVMTYIPTKVATLVAPYVVHRLNAGLGF